MTETIVREYIRSEVTGPLVRDRPRRLRVERAAAYLAMLRFRTDNILDGVQQAQGEGYVDADEAEYIRRAIAMEGSKNV